MHITELRALLAIEQRTAGSYTEAMNRIVIDADEAKLQAGWAKHSSRIAILKNLLAAVSHEERLAVDTVMTLNRWTKHLDFDETSDILTQVSQHEDAALSFYAHLVTRYPSDHIVRAFASEQSEIVCYLHGLSLEF